MSSAAEEPPTRSRNVGTQTLARGLRALELVATSTDGVSIQNVAAALGVHRTVAYRLLSTLSDFRLVTRGPDGRFLPGAGLTALSQGTLTSLREVASPLLRTLANELGSTVSLLVAEGEEAVAIAVVEPVNARYHVSFREGSRHPLDRGSAGIALQTLSPPRPTDPTDVSRARELGFASTHGQVEPGAYGIAVPLPARSGMPAACVNVITYRADVAERALGPVRQTVAHIAEALGAGPTLDDVTAE
ncbi:IclR family transcriptional regulator [Nocardioides sp. NPDC057772]|uniref:IclR family transcriptional regulator n=1 Tax=Nocardioides sp. NPDC057772 TaxID=3346245 RepID=UPI0036701CC7